MTPFAGRTNQHVLYRIVMNVVGVLSPSAEGLSTPLQLVNVEDGLAALGLHYSVAITVIDEGGGAVSGGNSERAVLGVPEPAP